MKITLLVGGNELWIGNWARSFHSQSDHPVHLSCIVPSINPLIFPFVIQFINPFITLFIIPSAKWSSCFLCIPIEIVWFMATYADQYNNNVDNDDHNNVSLGQ